MSVSGGSDTHGLALLMLTNSLVTSMCHPGAAPEQNWHSLAWTLFKAKWLDSQALQHLWCSLVQQFYSLFPRVTRSLKRRIHKDFKVIQGTKCKRRQCPLSPYFWLEEKTYLLVSVCCSLSWKLAATSVKFFTAENRASGGRKKEAFNFKFWINHLTNQILQNKTAYLSLWP